MYMYSPLKEQYLPKNHVPETKKTQSWSELIFLKKCIHLFISRLSTWHATWWWLQVVTCCCRPKSSLHMTHGWDESCLALDFSLIFFHSLSERRSSGASTRPSFWAVKNGIFKSGYACWYWCNETHIKLEISWIFSIIFVFMLPWREHERFSLCRCTAYV